MKETMQERLLSIGLLTWGTSQICVVWSGQSTDMDQRTDFRAARADEKWGMISQEEKTIRETNTQICR
jgi:hypothetical protein